MLRYMLGCLCALFMSVAMAGQSPVVMLQSTADSVIKNLKAQRANLKSNPTVAYQIVERILLPNVDVAGMSRSVIPPHIWRSAAPAEKARFTQEFVDLVVRTYAGALAQYTNEQVRFMPLTAASATGDSRLQVHSEIVRKSGPTIYLNIDFFPYVSSSLALDSNSP